MRNPKLRFLLRKKTEVKVRNLSELTVCSFHSHTWSYLTTPAAVSSLQLLLSKISCNVQQVSLRKNYQLMAIAI